MKKDNIKSVVVLFACCLVVALLLAAVNLVTAPIIEQNNQNAQFAALEGLVPNASYEEKTDLEGIPDSINGIFVDKNGGGVAIIFSASSQYSSSPMQYAVGIDMDGKIIAIKEIAYMESKDFGDYPESFVGQEYAGIDSVAAFSGVTYSSNAFKSGLKDAFTAFYAAIGGELKETEVDVLNTLVEGLSFTEIQTAAEFDSKITAVYRADATTYAFRYADGENVYLVVSDILGKVLASAVYEGAEGATIPTDFVAEAIKELVATEIIGKVLDKTSEFEYVPTVIPPHTVIYEIAFTGKREFVARTVANFRTAEGYVILVESQGYAALNNGGESIVLTVGFDKDGKITKTHVVSHAETSNIGGDKVIGNKDYTDKYIGLDDIPYSPNSFIDADAYATYTYVAYHNGVRMAYLQISALLNKPGNISK